MNANSAVDKLMGLADKIVALEGGRVVETGSPATLLESNGYINHLGLELTDAAIDEKTLHATHDDSTDEESRLSEDLIEEADATIDDARRKTGDASVYKYYFESSGWTTMSLFGLSLVLWIFFSEFPSTFLHTAYPQAPQLN